MKTAGCFHLKKEDFLIAMMAGVPVVTMLIWGGKNVKNTANKSYNLNKVINVKFFDPIDVSALPRGRKGREQLENTVRGYLEPEIEKYLEQEK